MEKLVDAVVKHLLDSPHLIHLNKGIYGNEVDRVIGRDLPLNVDGITVTDEFKIRQTEVKSLIIINRNGGLRFDPIYFPRVEVYSYGTPIEEAWDLDRIVAYVMEMSGVVRYEGEKFGSPVGESDGIPDLEGGNTGWPYVYRSFLMTMVGPTIE